ncbi:MAG TPA: serine protease, partial [Pirellulaceae bacterium]|nr:serine protease [Pirellulaceae bacterium]
GQRVIVDCATRGIDSKLDATVVLADANGNDLVVERRGGVLDFAVPSDGKYVIKVHELTFNGGPAYFYRLGVWEQPAGTPIVRQPRTKIVNSFSWPPVGLAEVAAATEVEPNNDGARAQKITLPCDVAGAFFPAADVDVFEFAGKKGEEWWIEVASERLGRPTDPAVLVQRVELAADGEQLTDVVELSDIPSPVRVSSNGYAYDGPPYNAGSSDVLGKLVIPQDGAYRLQLTDLFGGTRSDARNVYRLVIRRAAPDFALVAWALHMELRNGDRNALSKPLSLRGGATMALEVVAVRRDGFNEAIALEMNDLPPGVTARGLKIPAGQSRGIMLVTATQDAPHGLARASFVGRSKIGDAEVTRPCHLASMTWPIRDAWGEIPQPRLLADCVVSASGVDFAPLTIAPPAGMVFESTGQDKL